MHFRHFISKFPFLSNKYFNLPLTFVNLQVLAPLTGFEFVRFSKVTVIMESIFSFRLPEYEAMIHIKVSEFSKYLEKEIEALTSDFDLEESTGDDHHRDYHWQFNTWKQAVAAGERLKCLVTNPNIELLKVKANYHPEIQPIVHKDIRFSGKT